MSKTFVIRTDVALNAHQFVDLLRRSTLAARRPVDDAAAVELLKHPVALLENPHPNPKLTTPADLPYLEFLLTHAAE